MMTRPAHVAISFLIGIVAASSPLAWAEESRDIVVSHAGQQASAPGPDSHFTGAVRVDDAFRGTEPSRISGATVTFEPGARTAWHSHPLGQTLIITAGLGWVQRWGGPVETVRPGDVVWIPPGGKHWHGATASTAMTHIAVVEMLGGQSVDWMEKVSDAEYGAARN